jgi:hypothetical protein
MEKKKQNTTALSSVEAKYCAMEAASKKLS